MHLPHYSYADGKKLSKRKTLRLFFITEIVLSQGSFHKLLNPDGLQYEKRIKRFILLRRLQKSSDEKRLGLSGAFFDVKKLDWLNQHYLMNTISEKDLGQELEIGGSTTHSWLN